MKHKIASLARNKFLQGSIIFTITNFMVGFTGYLFNSLSAKTLGPRDYSEITALFSYLTIVSVPIGVLSTDIIRRLGQKGSKKREAFLRWDAWLWGKVFRWKILTIPYLLSILILPGILNIHISSAIAMIVLFPLSFIGAYYVAAFQGMQLFFSASLLIFLPQLIKLIGPILVLLHVDGLVTILSFIVLASIGSITIARFLIQKALPATHAPHRLLDQSLRKALLNKNLMITFISLTAMILLNNLDVIFVKKFFEADTAGLYGAWNLFSKIIFYAFGSMIGLSLIFFSSGEHNKHHRTVLIGLVFLIMFGGVVSFFTYKFAGSMLISIILSSQYLPIVNSLPMAALFGTFFTIIIFLNNFLLARNSPLALIGAISIPFYAGALFFFGTTLQNIYLLNVSLTLLIAAVYISTIIYYNIKRWKPKNQTTS